ncbi:MucB/RseB C-terminal domain-containing protein [Marinagarivorans algicola]|uniref:MucB/RseB C-terminal domain-containing protein n=1 Tax=Marinagarivorans algicola TaxID=1513270 RepID=UPI0012E140B6|nr:MucB/RseB C-terminal domain-containing protein [Marinagarivorans algicola]
MHSIKCLLGITLTVALWPSMCWAQAQASMNASSVDSSKPSALSLAAVASSHRNGAANPELKKAAPISPRAQLMLMAAAIENQSYQGTLTYEFGGPLETLAFEHLVSQQGTEERIRHLSGEPRNFSRSLPQNHCGNAAARLFMPAGGTPLQSLSRYYRFSMIGQNRIADRSVNVIQIQPIHEDRYGFTLGVDQASHLPLMLTITGRRGQVLERFQFVELNLTKPDFDAPSTVRTAQKLPFTQARCQAPLTLKGWQPSWLPAGFVVASTHAQANGHTVMSFTDGLASLSIFVAPIAQVTGAVGVVKRGATVAAMTMAAAGQQSFKVSVVGEVPPAVARRVASSVVYQP